MFKDIKIPAMPKNLSKKRILNKSGNFVYALFRYVILISIGYIVLYPLLYTIVTSLMTSDAFRDPTRRWVPKEITLFHYEGALKFLDYWNSLFLTIKTEVVSALLEVASCAVVGYGFARFNFKAKPFWTAILFMTILVPAPMIIIPLVTNFSHLDFLGILGLFDKLTGIDLRPNLIGTVGAFYIPSILGVGLRSGILVYIYIQFFKGLPRELEEAAWIDGAGPIRTFIKIAIPSSSVVIMTVTVFSLIWHWNDYFLAAMYMTGENTLGVSIEKFRDILTSYGHWSGDVATKGYLLAGCLLYITPILIVYMFLQRGFIESIDRVGITG